MSDRQFMFERIKNFIDGDMVRVLFASTGGFTLTMIVVDWALRIIISILTIWYLCAKIRQVKSDTTDQTKTTTDADALDVLEDTET